MAKIAEIVKNLAEEAAKKFDCSIFDIEYKKEGADYVLRVFIEKENPDENISINDCENVSRYLSDLLDENDPIANAYMLEVSSPGIDRPLRNKDDYEKYKGRLVDVGLFAKINGAKALTGTLAGYGDDFVVIEENNENGKSNEKIEIPLDKISSIKLAVIF